MPPLLSVSFACLFTRVSKKKEKAAHARGTLIKKVRNTYGARVPGCVFGVFGRVLD